MSSSKPQYSPAAFVPYLGPSSNAANSAYYPPHLLPYAPSMYDQPVQYMPGPVQPAGEYSGEWEQREGQGQGQGGRETLEGYEQGGAEGRAWYPPGA